MDLLESVHLLEVLAFGNLLSVERSRINFAPNEILFPLQSCLDRLFELLGPLFKPEIQIFEGIMRLICGRSVFFSPDKLFSSFARIAQIECFTVSSLDLGLLGES